MPGGGFPRVSGPLPSRGSTLSSRKREALLGYPVLWCPEHRSVSPDSLPHSRQRPGAATRRPRSSAGAIWRALYEERVDPVDVKERQYGAHRASWHNRDGVGLDLLQRWRSRRSTEQCGQWLGALDPLFSTTLLARGIQGMVSGDCSWEAMPLEWTLPLPRNNRINVGHLCWHPPCG